MKSLLRTLFVLTLICGAEAQAASKETVTFDGKTLYLESSEKGKNVELKEFLVKGETFEKWNQLAGLFVYPDHRDAKAVVQGLVQSLKDVNPETTCQVMENSDTGETLVDFVTWPKDWAFVEYNIFKYGTNEKGAVVAQQYAIREYKDIPGFLKNLQPLRTRLVEAIAAGKFKVSK